MTSMSETIYGTIVSVASFKAGQALIEPVSNSTVLSLPHAMDFSPRGGTLLLDEVPMIYVSADHALSTVTLESPATVDEGAPVEVFPAVWEVRAKVMADNPDPLAPESEDLDVLVPYTMRPLLPEGIREGEGERVRLVMTDGQYVIDDVLDEKPEITDEEARALAEQADQKAIAAQTQATTAIQTADGKNTVTFSPDFPPTDQLVFNGEVRTRPASDTVSRRDGDLWWVQSGGAPNISSVWQYTTNVYEYTGTYSGPGWVLNKLDDSVVNSLTASKLTTGVLNAATTITTGDPNGTHTVLGQSSLQVWRPDGDGVPQVTVSVGGADQDVLMITDPASGATLAGFDGDGSGYAQDFGAGSLSIGGQPIGDPYNLDDILFQFPRGAIARYAMTVDSTRAGTTPLGVCEIGATCYSYRMYRARFEGNFYCNTTGTFRLFLYYTVGGATPTINSSQMVMGIFPITVTGYRRASIEGYFFVPGLDPSSPNQVRILLAMQRLAGAGEIWHHADGGDTPGRFTVEDIGPTTGFNADLWNDGLVSTGGGTPASGGGGTTVPPTAKQTYTKTYTASWSRNWGGGSAGNSEIRQGYYSSRYYGAVGFPSQVQTDLSGASISKIELYMYANHWYYNNGGTAVIGAHTASSVPASFPAGSTTFNANWPTKSGGLWITIPSTWYPYWASGNNKGFTFGDGASTSYTYYGRFNGVGMANPPKLRVTYQR